MKFFIYANGGKKIGLGHIMRTLVLAKEINKNFEITYICDNRPDVKEGIEKIHKAGLKVIYSDNLLNILDEKSILIIDKYDISENELKKLKEKVVCLIYIDDNNQFEKYYVDIILNQNIHGINLNYNTLKETKKLIGVNYTLLRDEFLELKPIEIKKDIENILLTVGGSDNFKLTNKILNKIKCLNAKIKVIIGPAFKSKNELKSEFRNFENISFYENANIGELMCKSDLAISACGSTIYELCYLGVPTIGFIIVENQKLIGKYLNDKEIILLSSMENILIDFEYMTLEKRKKLSVNMKSLIDGKGKYRVVKEIEKLIENKL